MKSYRNPLSCSRRAIFSSSRSRGSRSRLSFQKVSLEARESVLLNWFNESSMKVRILGTGVRLYGVACQRLISSMTSDAFWRLKKLTRPCGGRKSGLPSTMNWSVERKTPWSSVRKMKLIEVNELTDEWHAGWCDGGHELSVLGEGLTTINRDFTSGELGDDPLIHLFPCALQSTDRRRVQSRSNRNHRREVVEDAAALGL